MEMILLLNFSLREIAKILGKPYNGEQVLANEIASLTAA